MENQPGLVTSFMSTLFPAIILSHWAFALVSQLVSQLRPSLLTDYSPHSYQSDLLIVLKTLSSQLPFLLLATDRPPCCASNREIEVALGHLQDSSFGLEHISL